MAKPLTVLKSVGPKLVPFFKTVALYFVLYGEENKPSIICCIFKCLPIISLMIFVLLHGMSFCEYYRYSRRILIGLIFSIIGDALLVWKQWYFELALMMFAIAQMMYARAFSWKPFNPYAATVIYTVGAFIYYYISMHLTGQMVYLVGLYIVLIATMGWRAIARVQFFDDLWTWTKLCGCAGAISFMISDFLIAVDRFVRPIPFSHPLIMFTYYAAQFGISLSIVDSQADEILLQSKKDK